MAFKQYSYPQKTKETSFFDKPKLRPPVKYEEMFKECDGVWIKNNEKLEGFNMMLAKVLNQNSYSATSVIHQLTLHESHGGGGGQPQEYSIAVQHKTKNGLAFCKIDSSQIVFAQLNQKFFDKKIGLDLSYNSFNRTIDTKVNYKGDDCTISGKFAPGSGSYSASYVQSVTERVASGVQLSFEEGKSGLNTGVRYHTDQFTVGSEYKIKQTGKNNTHNLKLNLCQNVDHGFDVVAEGTWKITEKKFAYKYGFSQNFLKSHFRVTATDDWKVSIAMDHQLTMNTGANFMCDWSPEDSSFKFGLGVSIQQM
jgi:hypothetical protein